MAADRPQLVQALYTFKATNNDELTFKKGDVITLTQCDDADWWEGTLADTTGWFPANYVKECSAAGEAGEGALTPAARGGDVCLPWSAVNVSFIQRRKFCVD